jgi:poly-gamma-glutamate synthesis protein (capsule biosynthesis protein)
MKKTYLLLLTPWLLLAGYHAAVSPITPAIQKRMIRGHSWHRGCPVGLNDLRYLRMTYRGFDGRDHVGEMVVHRNVARDVTAAFGEMYRSGYPIKEMKLVSSYRGNDTVSINHDNTSAFNCRAVTGGTKWSNHSYGTAIDINPLENPYVSRSGHIAHRESYAYDRRHRTHHGAHPRAVIVSGDPIVHSFKRRGWRWGGDWHSVKDYQHFDKPGAQH